MNSRIKRGRFILAWLVAGIAVLPLSVTMAIIALSTFSEAMPVLWSSSSTFGTMLSLAIAWLINGFCIGFLQKAVVKRYLRVDLGSWKVFSVLGALLAGTIAYPCMEGSCFPPQFYDDRIPTAFMLTLESSRIVLLYLTVFSTAQCLALSRIVPGSWRWVAAHVGSVVIAALASLAALTLPGAVYYDALVAMALYVLVVTLVTGLLMRRMLSSHITSVIDSHDEWAYEPAPLDSAVGCGPFRLG